MLPVTRFGNGICIQSARAVKYVKQICSRFLVSHLSHNK